MNSRGLNKLTEIIIGKAIRVHRRLDPGFLESVYQATLANELNKADIHFEKEKSLPVHYDDIVIDIGFRCDFLVEQSVIIECKAVNKLTEIDTAQLLNYLKLSKLTVGLLINFNVLVLKHGIRRITLSNITSAHSAISVVFIMYLNNNNIEEQ